MPDLFGADRPLVAMLVPLAAAGLIRIFGRHPTWRESCTYGAGIITLWLVASMLPVVLDGGVIETSRLSLVPGVSLHLRADALGLLFALVASTLWLLTSIYSVGYMRAGGYANQTGYFSSFALCVSATIGLAFAANLLSFFLFYEVLTLATYPLVAHKRTPKARAGGRTYLVYTLTAGQALLLAIVWTYALAPGGEFRPGGLLPPGLPAGTVIGLFALFVAGIGVKVAIMPLHGWLPAAMVAPTPVSALLHAVAVVKAGAFGCLRVVGYVFGVDVLREVGADTVLAVIASATILFASFRALGETHLKRRLAYSTVSQLSYIVLGAAIGSVTALAGAMFHIVAHGFMKITMFFCAGAIHTESHRDDITQLGGIGRQMPITMTAFTIAAAGLAGTPLLAGFVSKWNLGLGALEAGQGVFIAVLVTSGLLNMAYFFPIVYDAFFTPAHGEVTPERWTLTLPLATTAVAALLLGIMPDFGAGFYRLAWSAAMSVVAGSAAGGVP
jgi:multicomponent Na+:H+ antiporter subunit D